MVATGPDMSATDWPIVDGSGEDRNVVLFPLSHGQENMWLASQMFPDVPLFNLHNAFRLRMSVDRGVLERAVNEVVRRHEVLRTVFRLVDDAPAQVVLPSVVVPLPVDDMTDDLTGGSTREALVAEARKPFHLDEGPLIRTRLLRLGAADYLLSLTMHHLISDGWSLGIFLRELTTVWGSLTTGSQPELPELSVQYGDYAAWQQESLATGAFAEQLRYWQEQLQGLPELDIPADRPGPAQGSHVGGVVPVNLSPSLTQLATSCAAEEQATLFMTLLSVFAVLLHRYTGQDNFAVGTYIAGRNRAELEPLIGFFVNTLAIPVSMGGGPSFREVVARCKRVLVDAYANQDIPFTKLVQQLGAGRSLGRNPLVSTVFQVINVPTLIEDEGEEFAPLDVDKGTAIFDLTFTLWPSGFGMRGNLEYNADLFDRVTVERLVGHFRSLLESALLHPDTPVGELRFLPQEELGLLISGFNAVDVGDDDLRGLAELWSDQVSRHPGATAFRCGTEDLTYGQLDRRAETLAQSMRDIGVGSGAVIGICLERGLEFPVALMAIIKTGAAFLPLDPAYPVERLAFMVSDAKAKVVITTEALGSLFDRSDADMLLIDGGDEGDQDIDGMLPSVDPGDLAYIIYTSGSTGSPKGARVPHRQLLNRLRWMWRTYPFRSHEVACHKTASSFVDSIWELLGGLLQGIPTVIVPDHVVRDPRALVDTLADGHVSRIWVVPSLLRLMLESIDDLGSCLPELRFWVTTGEPVDVHLYDCFRQAVPQGVLHNVYGTSEVWDATWWDPQREEPPQQRVPIGRPIDNVTVYVLDRFLQPVPIGIPGELHVGGVALADGYVGLAELTAQRFIPNPFSDAPDARLYRTGDMVKFRVDGCIEFLGRRDQRVKIRGFRVEPSEVESTLMSHLSLKAAAVTAYDSPEGKRLAAYVTTRNGAAPTATELRAYVRDRLPDHMVPTELVFVESLPMTPSGKVNRRALAAPSISHQHCGTAQELPSRLLPLERTVLKIWQEVLRREDIGLRVNFFDLGGDSLLLVRVNVRLCRALGKEVQVNDLFRYPTVESIAAHLGSLGHDGRLDCHERPQITAGSGR